MSKAKVAPKRRTLNVPTPAVSGELEPLLIAVESRCAHAAGIVNAAARVIAGDELGLKHEDVPSVYEAALGAVVGELEELSDRAGKLRVRTAGGAA